MFIFAPLKDKERILITADKHFKKFGIKGVSMNDLSNQLGISKKTIYQHYDNKEKLVEDTINFRLQCVNQSIDICKENINPLEQLYAMYNKLVAELRNISPNYFYDLKKYYPRLWNIIQEHRRNNLPKVLLNNYKLGKKEGFYREMNFELSTHYLIKLIDMTLNDEFSFTNFSREQVIEDIVKHHIYSLLTNQGKIEFEQLLSYEH